MGDWVLNEAALARGGYDVAELEEKLALSAGGDSFYAGLTVTAEQRRSLAKNGQALGPDGDFPIPDADHLAAAKSEYEKGNLAGHSAAEVRAHINRNAKRLGEPGLDDGEQTGKKRKPGKGKKRKADKGQRIPDTDGSEGFQGGGYGDAAGGPSGAGEGGSMAATAGYGAHDNGGAMYTEEQLRDAFLADEVARLSMTLGGPQRPAYAGLSVPEPVQPDEVDDDVLVRATMELAARTAGQASFADVADATDELALSRSPDEAGTTAVRAAALGELVQRFPGETAEDLELARESEIARLSRRRPSQDGRVDDIVARNRDMLSDQPRRGLMHTTVVTDEDPTDHAAPSRGTVVHPEVRRLLEQAGVLLGWDQNGPPVRPKSAAQREAEERRARAGHQAGQYSIQELHSAAMRSGGR